MNAASGARVQLAVAILAGGALATGTVVHLTTSGAVARPRSSTQGAPIRPLSAAVDPNSLKPPGNWKLLWSDEFQGTGAVDNTKWFAQTGDRKGWGIGGLAYYDPAQARRNGHGQLIMTAARNTTNQQCWYGRCAYRSARIQTAGRFSLRYGRFAARIRFPSGKGVFPAFWLQTENTPYGSAKYGEIDIAEIFGARPRNVLGFAHGRRRVASHALRLPKPVSAATHTYGVDWTPKSITWWVDGKVYGQRRRYPSWPFTRPMQIILTLQIGGDWQGPPKATTRFPARMGVDWVRVYGKPSAPHG